MQISEKILCKKDYKGSEYLFGRGTRPLGIRSHTLYKQGEYYDKSDVIKNLKENIWSYFFTVEEERKIKLEKINKK